MVGVRNIKLFQFRNYETQNFQFSQRIVAITGKNGSGKTNLLDAIYFLCFTKSYFSKPDPQSVLLGHAGFRIEGIIQKNEEKDLVTCILRENNKKEFSLNKEVYKKFSDHIGRFPCVMVAPDDIELIIGGSENRRKMLDTLLSQLDADYLKTLILYNQLVSQRNSFLKSTIKGQNPDAQLLDIYDQQIAPLGTAIFEKRKTFLKTFSSDVLAQYTYLADNADQIQIEYQSSLLDNSMEDILRQNRTKDILLQRTSAGIHRDDLVFSMGDISFKSQASQGQRKSLLFALKLAEFNVLKQEKNCTPILLLDDIFEKLDEDRMYNLLKNTCVENKGSVFITDTHSERIKNTLGRLDILYQLIEL